MAKVCVSNTYVSIFFLVDNKTINRTQLIIIDSDDFE